MSLQTVARRYAAALADVTIERREEREVQNELDQWAAMMEAAPQLKEVFANPTVAYDQKRKVLGRPDLAQSCERHNRELSTGLAEKSAPLPVARYSRTAWADTRRARRNGGCECHNCETDSGGTEELASRDACGGDWPEGSLELHY